MPGSLQVSLVAPEETVRFLRDAATTLEERGVEADRPCAKYRVLPAAPNAVAPVLDACTAHLPDV